jgi:glycosyltransferase involved in cell wall biosynthesis
MKALRDLQFVYRLINRRQGRVVLVGQTTHYAVLLVQRLLSLFGRRVDVYLFNFYLHEMGQRRLVQRILKFLLRGRVGMLVQAPNELAYFRSVAPSAEIDYYPYCLSDLPAGVEEGRASGTEVFAGGYTNRDYDTLVEAARLLPQIPVVIACARANKIAVPVPENVEIVLDLPAIDFHQRMARSRLVVVPLKNDVGSSGQMVALAAMKLRKPVLYTAFPAVSQYFVDGETGIGIRAGDVDGLVTAILRIYDEPALSESIGARAHNDVLARFSRRNFEQEIVTKVLQFCRVPKKNNSSYGQL